VLSKEEDRKRNRQKILKFASRFPPKNVENIAKFLAESEILSLSASAKKCGKNSGIFRRFRY
jgi:hypothetical protein